MWDELGLERERYMKRWKTKPIPEYTQRQLNRQGYMRRMNRYMGS